MRRVIRPIDGDRPCWVAIGGGATQPDPFAGPGVVTS